MPRNNTINDYSVRQVSDWVESFGLPSQPFLDNKIDGDLLLFLNRADMMEIGLTSLQAGRLERELGQTKFSSHDERAMRTLDFLIQQNDDLRRENMKLESRNATLEAELKMVKKAQHPLGRGRYDTSRLYVQ